MSNGGLRPVLQRAACGTEAVVRGLDRAARALIVTLFAAIVLVGGLQVFCRYVLNASLSWSEEFQRYGLIWIVFLALVLGYRRGTHIGMDFLGQKIPRIVVPLGWLTDALWLVLGLAMLVFTCIYRSPAGLTFLSSVARQSSAGMGLRMDFAYGCMVIGGAYLTLAALNNVIRRVAGIGPVSETSGGKRC